METRSNQRGGGNPDAQQPAWKQVATAFALAVGMLSSGIGAAEPQRFSASEPHMGVEYEIVLFAENEAAAKKPSGPRSIVSKSLTECSVITIRLARR